MGLLITLLVIVVAVAVIVALVKLVVGLVVLIAGALAAWWAYRKLTGPRTSEGVVTGSSSDRAGLGSR